VTLGALSVTVFATLVFLLSPELRRLPEMATAPRGLRHVRGGQA
jgi:hypothetical protein